MNLKKWKIVSIFLIFALSGLAHFIYDWFPNFFTSLIFPVNESIWEHNKIILLSFLILTILEKIYYKNNKNVIYANLISSICCSLLIMTIFTPIYLYILKTKENMIVTFVIYFISIAISEYINYRLLKQKYNFQKEKIATFLWLFLFGLNAVLTFYPPHLALFYDYKNHLYGIK